MMSNSSAKNPIVTVLGITVTAITSLSGIVALISMLASSTAKRFFESYALLGWGLASCLVVIGPAAIWLGATYIGKSKANSLDAAWKDREKELEDNVSTQIRLLKREDWARDRELLNERMTGWELNGEFHQYLVEHVYHKRLPMHFVRRLENKVDVWRRDPRDFTDSATDAAWNGCQKAAENYVDMINAYMWLVDDKEFMSVPSEWSAQDPEQYWEALRKLEEASRSLADSLVCVYRVQHAPASSVASIALSSSDSKDSVS